MFPKEERPEAEAIRVRLVKLQQPMPTAGLVWYADFHLYQVNKNSPLGMHTDIARLSVPCRSNLYKFLIGLLFNFNWNFQGDIDVTKEQAKYLEIVFTNQKDYKFWKQGLAILNKEGKEKAWIWIEEQVPLLKLRNVLEQRT